MNDQALISAISRVLARGVEATDKRLSAQDAPEGSPEGQRLRQEWTEASEDVAEGIRGINRLIATTPRGVAFKLCLITYALHMATTFGDDPQEHLGRSVSEAIADAVVELEAIGRQEGGA